MRQPNRRDQNSPSSQNTTIVVVAGLLGVGVIVLVVLVALLLRQNGAQSSLPALSTASQTPVIPTLFVPTPDCGSPTLVIGATTFQIQTIQNAPDGSLTSPADGVGIAYWVQGTDTNYAFALSPTPDNLSLVSTLATGNTAKATWSNCNSTTYSLFAPEPGIFDASALPDQSIAGITIFFQTDTSGNGFVVRGELTEEQISTINTPASGGSEIQAEISLLETTASPDGTTIQIGVSIQNYGGSAFMLSASDISLTPQDAAPLVMAGSDPPLPKEITPGATETIYFAFPRPASPTAVLKIFTIEYDIEGY
jgi:hypothetical protein